MPLYLRTVTPVNVGRKYSGVTDATINETKKSSLVESKEECVNRTLSNIIRQLADLGQKSNDIFEGLEIENRFLRNRVSMLSNRIQNVANNVQTLYEEDFKSKLIFEDKSTESGDPWKSTYQADAGLFIPASRPNALKALYESCEPVPHLNMLQEFREDDKNCVKLYSDPEMFFFIWKQELIKESKKMREQRKNRKNSEALKAQHTRKVYQPHKIKTRRELIAEKELKAGNISTLRPAKESQKSVEKVPKIQPNEIPVSEDSFDNEEFADDIDFPEPPDDLQPCNDGSNMSMDLPSPDFLAPGPSPPLTSSVTEKGFSFLTESSSRQLGEQPMLPSPPPTPPLMEPVIATSIPVPPPIPLQFRKDDVTNEDPKVSSGNLANQLKQGVQLKKTQPRDENTGSALDDRSDLLRQIRCGKQLRKVTVNDNKKKTGSHRIQNSKDCNNVAELMMKYLDQRFDAMHGSDSEDSNDGDESMFEENDFD